MKFGIKINTEISLNFPGSSESATGLCKGMEETFFLSLSFMSQNYNGHVLQRQQVRCGIAQQH